MMNPGVDPSWTHWPRSPETGFPLSVMGMGTTSGLAQVNSWACPQWDFSFRGLFCPDPASCQALTALVLLEVEGVCAKPARVGVRTQDTERQVPLQEGFRTHMPAQQPQDGRA